MMLIQFSLSTRNARALILQLCYIQSGGGIKWEARQTGETKLDPRRTACEHIEPPPAAKMSQKQNHLAGEGNTTNLVLPANA